MSHLKTSLLPALTLVTVFGCSVLNSPDDLKPPASGDGDGTGGNNLGGTSGDGDGTGGSEAMPTIPPTTGLIVAAGTSTDDDTRVLVTLSAANGKELNREAMKAVAIAYDEAPGRFVWYVFTSASVSPGANTLSELHVRRWDDESEAWSTISKSSALPPPLLHGQAGAAPGNRPTSHFRPVVLNQRLAYVSQTIDDGSPVQSVTILDTSDLNEVSVVESLAIPDTAQIVGLVGRRGTELDAEARGGSLSMMVAQECDAVLGTCNLEARPVTVGGSVKTLAPDDFGPFAGVPAFASSPVLSDTVERPFDSAVASLGAYAIAFDPNGMDPRWWGFDPSNPASKDSPSSLPNSEADSFAGLAVWECLAAGIASTSGTDNDDLHAIHLANAAVVESPLADSGGDLLIEPFRGNVITMRSQDDTQPALRAFQIEVLAQGTGSERIALAERTVWSAPDDIEPIAFAVRLPEKPDCQ